MRLALSPLLRETMDTKMKAVPAPLVYRQANNDKLVLVLPDSRMADRVNAWCGKRKKVRWNPDLQAYIILAKYLNQVTAGMVKRYGVVWIILDSQPTERCDTRCRDAEGTDCNCKCLGRNHGGTSYINDWHHVGDTTLIRWPSITRSKYIAQKENV